MHDHSVLPREAALLIRPIPSTMATGDEPIAFGGKPQLPKHLEWPRQHRGEPETFFAQINLAKLHRAAGQTNLPDHPETGTLFVFLPLTGDGIYEQGEATVLFYSGDVSDLPEREPPEDLLDLLEYEISYVHADGTTDGGRVLIRQWAEIIPFSSERAVNPLAVNMAESAGAVVGPWKDAHTRHEQTLVEALANARPFPPPPEHVDWMDETAKRLPSEFTRYNWQFKPYLMDWEFFFDWSKEFYRLCYNMSLKHFAEMRKAGNTQRLVPYFARRYKRQRKKLNQLAYRTGRKPIFWTFENPRPVSDNFDRQAERWMALSQFEAGDAPPRMLNAFIDMLVEIRRHYDDTDDEGYKLPPRVGMLDHLIKGHDKHAGWTYVDAKNAFKKACERASQREEARFNDLPQTARWDTRVIQSQPEPLTEDHRFSLGIMPLQMFGQGFEIQQAVTEHVDDVLLLQIGDSFGLPIEIGPDMIVQLWISPQDLAEARFDRVEMTLEMT